MRFSQAFTNKYSQTNLPFQILKKSEPANFKFPEIGNVERGYILIDSEMSKNILNSDPNVKKELNDLLIEALRKYIDSHLENYRDEKGGSFYVLNIKSDNGGGFYIDLGSNGDGNSNTIAQAEGGVSPGQAAADLGVDISSTENGVHSEGKNPPNPRKKKKKKKKTKAELINYIENVKEQFMQGKTDIKNVSTLMPFHGKLNTDQIMKKLNSVEDSIVYIEAIKNSDDVMSKFVVSIDINSAVNASVNKLSEVREILRNAEMVETDNTKRSILYDLDNKIRDLSSNIQYLSSNFF